MDLWTGGDGKHWHRRAHTGPDQVLRPAPLFRTLEDPQLTPSQSLVLTTWASPTSLPWLLAFRSPPVHHGSFLPQDLHTHHSPSTWHVPSAL